MTFMAIKVILSIFIISNLAQAVSEIMDGGWRK